MGLKMLFSILIVLPAWLTFVQSQESRRDCNIDYEFPCDNGQCINKQQWCDGRYDCSDGTDEYYCDGTPCMDHHFRCRSGRCIPKFAACDKYADCPDGSDEICGEKSEYLPLGPDISLIHIEQLGLTSKTNVIRRAIDRAANYLLNEMRSGNIKGASIFRAVVALAFVERIHTLSESEKELMKKQLNIQLTLDLMQGVGKLALSELALRINALYAVCENPRSFHGKDLVNILRTRTDVALNSPFNFPFVLLTLCVAGEHKHIDLLKMDEIYKLAGSDRIGVKALGLMGMICGDRTSKGSSLQSRVSNFFSMYKGLESSHIDVYTKALFLQASHAAGIEANVNEILRHQLRDGSFGDVLATYHAIPALLNTSVLELKCENQSSQMDMLMDSPIHKGENGLRNITYSIWITAGNEMNSHSMVIEVDGSWTFYDVMKAAAIRDKTFRFMCDDTVIGKKLYSISGIPNDPESGFFWTLYRTDSRTTDVRSMNQEKQGLDTIVPKENEHFIFHLRQVGFN